MNALASLQAEIAALDELTADLSRKAVHLDDAYWVAQALAEKEGDARLMPDPLDEFQATVMRLAQAPCPICQGEGWWLDAATGFRYCTCAAGARAKEEDEGSD